MNKLVHTLDGGTDPALLIVNVTTTSDYEMSSPEKSVCVSSQPCRESELRELDGEGAMLHPGQYLADASKCTRRHSPKHGRI